MRGWETTTKPMLTVLEIIKRTTEFLEKRGIESARLNSELLIGHALGLKRMQLYLQFERPLSEAELEKIRPFVKRRSQREPLQYILGETEFAGLKLKVDRRALIPRPETEYLIELIGAQLASPPATILDLGTGSGAIALALAAKYPAAQVTGVDQSTEALALAGENAARLELTGRVQFLPSDWFSAVSPGRKFALIAANPPYLSEAEVAEAEPEVKDHEPKAALQHILANALRYLEPGGLLICETGIAQHKQLMELAATTGYAQTKSLTDLTGRERYLSAFA